MGLGKERRARKMFRRFVVDAPFDRSKFWEAAVSVRMMRAARCRSRTVVARI